MKVGAIMRGVMSLGLVVALAALSAVPAVAGKHALLVGCTVYPELAQYYQLSGAQNDVELMRDFLIQHFAFPPENIVILAEQNATALPTRANIAAEFERLSKIVSPGDQVVILLAGHGSQQPVPPDNDPAINFEPDGLDEVFLARDAKGLSANEAGKITNGIVDDEIHDWLERILDAGASVWIIFDTCHSGTMVRGSDAEVSRRVAPEDLVPEHLLREAEARAARPAETTRGGEPAAPHLSRPSLADRRLAAFYAAQPIETTPETRLPKHSPEAKQHGLFTFALLTALGECSAPITYRELLHRIQRLYTRWDRPVPTPAVEGGDQDRFVLGMAEGLRRSPLELRRAADGSLSVTAGQLQGLTAGSILAVYPEAGERDAGTPIGHVRVTRVRTFDARVEPCAFERTPVQADLPAGGRCEVVELDAAAERLRVAVDDRDNSGEPLDPALLARWREEMSKIDTGPKSPLRVVTESDEADWLVRLDRGVAVLVPAAGRPRGVDGAPSEFGPIPVDEIAVWLESRLRAIARARTLLQLAATSTETFRGRAATDVNVEVELLRYQDADDRRGQVVPRETADLTLQEGDIVALRLRNRSRMAVDVTLLFVDSGYGITPMFPPPDTVYDNRISPGGELIVPPMEVTATTLGKEHMAVIATAAQRQPLDFRFLAQPTLDRLRGRQTRSPLVALFETTIYQEGQTRGLRPAESKDYALQLMSWQVR